MDVLTLLIISYLLKCGKIIQLLLAPLRIKLVFAVFIHACMKRNELKLISILSEYLLYTIVQNPALYILVWLFLFLGFKEAKASESR